MYASIATRLIINAGKALDEVTDRLEPRVTPIAGEPNFLAASQKLNTKANYLGLYRRPDGNGDVYIY